MKNVENRVKIGNRIIALLCVTILIGGCFAAGSQKHIKFHKVNVLYKLPVVFNDSAEMIIDSTCILYAGDYMLYELPYRKTEEIDNVLILDTMLNNFFVHKKGAEYGLLLQTINDSTGKRLPVDSMLKNRVKKNFDILYLFAIEDKEKSYKNRSDSILLNVMALNDQYFDSAYLYFNTKLQSQPYSLSEKVDSIYNSKLYKVDILMKKNTSVNAKYLNNFRHLSLEFSVLPVTNEAELDRFFDRIKKQLDK
jgi:hypothetical protein